MCRKHPDDKPVRICVSLLIAVAVATVFAVVAAMIGGSLSASICRVSLLLGAVAGGLLYWRGNTAVRTVPPTAWEWAALFLFGIAVARSFFWVGFEQGAELRVQSPYNLGDFALHLGLVRYLASGVSFWPESPIFHEGALRYPVGMDLFNALLLGAGVPVLRGFVWAGLVGGGLAAFALLRWGGAFAIAALLFNGGLWAFAAFPPEWTPSPDSGIEWKNLFLSVFVTQRGFLWALPAGLLLLICWRRRLEGDEPPVPRIAEWALYAAMPLFHLHTFLFFSLLLATCFFFAPSGRARRTFFLLGIASVPVASALVWLVTGGFSPGGAFGWHPGWMQGEQGLWFWWMNFGISLPLLAWLLIVVAHRGSRSARVIVGTSFAAVLVAVLFRLAPWPWDNIKILVWAWLACTPFLWSNVLRPLPIAVRASLCVLLFASGALALFDGLAARHSYVLAGRVELAEARGALRTLPPTARVACAPEHSHPALLLGRAVYLGYPGHLWSHGYDYADDLAELRRFFTEGTRPRFMSENQPVYAFLGEREKSFFKIDGPPVDAGWRALNQAGGTAIYECPPPGPTLQNTP